jgi:hypothetical protein
VNPIPPAVDLDTVLGGAEPRVDREACCRRGCERPRIRLVGGARRIPPRRPGELGVRQPVGALVLDPLELADRSSELLAHLRVLGRRFDAPLRDPNRLGREHHRSQVPDTVWFEREDPGRRYGHTSNRDLGDAPRRVETRELARLELVVEEYAPGLAGACHDQPGKVTRHHRTKRSRHQQVLSRRVGLQRSGERDRAHDLTRGQSGEQVDGELLAGRLDHRGGEHRGKERTGRTRAAELLEDDDELGHPEALAPERFVDVQAEPSLRGEIRPERRQRFPLGLQRRPCDLRRAVTIDPAPHCVVQRLVLLGDPNRHAFVPLLPSQVPAPVRQSRRHRGSYAS